MKRSIRLLAASLSAALLVTACGDAPEDVAQEPNTDAGVSPTEAGGLDEEEDPQAESFLACQVTDTGGVDDRSFNQTAYQGLLNAEAEFGVEPKVLESSDETDFAPNITAFIEQGCDLIVTVGFLLGQATQEAAEANPDQLFAIVDVDFFDPDAGEDISFDNVKELTFATDQAAFLAGYLAAGMTETGTVGTYGGINIPPVTIFMDGFLAGVNFHNAQKGTEVEVLGWDGSDGSFTGNFESQDDGRRITDQMLAEGADIIMPVAGPVGLGSAAAIEEAGRGKLIWVDTDGFVSAPQFSSLMLTSVMKNMDIAVKDTIERAVNGEFEGGLYLGTLDNGGVGIAPFHDFEDDVPQELKDELDAIREQIISGELSVDPADHAG